MRFVPLLREENMPGYLTDAVLLVAQAARVPFGSAYEALAGLAGPELKARPRLATQRWVQELIKARLLHRQPMLKPGLHQLKDLPAFRGLLHNLSLETNAAHLPALAAVAQAIWAGPLPQAHIIGAWLTRGDYSRYNGYSVLGDKYMLGGDDFWYTLLTNTKHVNKLVLTLPGFLLDFAAATDGTGLENLLPIRQV